MSGPNVQVIADLIDIRIVAVRSLDVEQVGSSQAMLVQIVDQQVDLARNLNRIGSR